MLEEQIKAEDSSIENVLSWKSLALRVFGGYILVSTVSQIFFPYPTGNNWTPAQKFVGSALGYLLQYFSVLIVVSIIAMLIARIPTKNRSKPLPPFINRALIGTLIVSGFLIYGGWHGAKMTSEEASTSRLPQEISASEGRAKIIATITRQDSEGVISSDLDQDGLRNLESWIVSIMLQKGKSRYAELGYDPSKFNPKVVANSVYINVQDKKLAVIKIRLDDVVRSATIIGIEKNELIRVNCIRNSNHDIAIFSGECGNKINEAFGVSINP